MKTYTIKKRRDGQGFNFFGTLVAKNWQDAKKVFTDMHRNSAASDSGFIYIDDEIMQESDMKEEYAGYYEGAGYYPQYHASIIFDSVNVDTIRDDVYTYTIRKV